MPLTAEHGEYSTRAAFSQTPNRTHQYQKQHRLTVHSQGFYNSAECHRADRLTLPAPSTCDREEAERIMSEMSYPVERMTDVAR